MSDTAPITLCTDSSDYGVGGYLFQTVDGIDQPVAFVIKSLSKSQLRWSVIQKEAYGIFYSLRDSEQLHAYLTEHKLRFLIPQKFLK